MIEAKLVTLILVTDTIGRGVDGDPIQPRETLFTLSGEVVATRTALGDKNELGTNEAWGELAAQETKRC